MALLLDASTTGTSTSFSHTVGTTLPNRVLTLTVMLTGTGGSPANNVTATYGGVSMTKIAEEGGAVNGGTAASFYLINPPTGSNTVAISYSGSSSIVQAVARSYYGAKQDSSVIRAYTTYPGSNVANPNVNVTSAVGDIVLDCISSDVNESFTVGAGQTQIFQASGKAASFESGAAPTVNMGWTTGGGQYRVMVAFSLAPALDGGGGPVVSPSLIF